MSPAHTIFEGIIVNHFSFSAMKLELSLYFALLGLLSWASLADAYLQTRNPLRASRDLMTIRSTSSLDSHRNKAIPQALIASLLLSFNPVIVHAIDKSPSLVALRNIQRVQESLQYVRQDIEKGSTPGEILKEVQILLKNYKLRENIDLSTQLVSKESRYDAQKLGREAFEDLAQVTEYFPDEFDDVSGKKVVPQEILMFAQQATQSAEKKLNQMMTMFPSEALSSLKTEE
jgi:hypothetical protein